MSLASATNRNSYVGNGATAAYDYTFRIFDEDDLKVIVKDTDDVETVLTKTTDYTVSGVGVGTGGAVTLVNSGQAWLTGANLTTGYTIVIRRIIPLTQNTDIRNQGDFYPEAHEDQFDRAAMIAQQQQDDLDRSLKLSEVIDPANFDATIPASIVGQANVTFMTNATGDGIVEGPTANEISGAQASAELAEDWATKVDGQVAATDYSSKAWAIGGTGVTDTASRGAAKEWAIETASTVDGTEFSAKEYAQGSQAATGGSAKNWAQQTGADVTGASAGDMSAKEWAVGTLGRGVAGEGSAKDWATYTAGTVDNAGYSAKYWAEDAQATAQGLATDLSAIEADIDDLELALPAGDDYLQLQEAASPPTTPAAGYKKIYADTDGQLYAVDSGGNVRPVGSGGGGGGLRIIEGDNAPVKEYEDGWEYYSYEPGQGQKLFLNLHVPSTYVAGSPINVKIKWACASTSGDALIRAVATLVRAENDAYTSTTNQRTTTNAAVTVSAGTANEMQKINLDVSSSIGQVNAVAVAAGDTLKIQIEENGSTVADVIKYFFDLTEVTFS